MEKQDILNVGKNAAIMEKHSALKAATIKLADMETLAGAVEAITVGRTLNHGFSGG